MKKPGRCGFSVFVVCLLGTFLISSETVKASDATKEKSTDRVQFKIDDSAGSMQILVDGKEALVYQYGKDVDIVHYFPVRSPSGKEMTIQKTDPYPHHRSFWFADQVQMQGERKSAPYFALYSGKDKKNPAPPYKDRIRHQEFTQPKYSGNQGEIGMKLVWEMDQKTPVINETRTMRVVALGEGEYFLDLNFTVTPAGKPVKFVSDKVHYAWPFIRINKAFSVDGGGTLSNSEGGKNQKETDLKKAWWVDYSNKLDGATEGLTMFQFPQTKEPPLWLTRDYGSFGPRRIDAQSGKVFELKSGESLSQRAGVLVHRGDVKEGKVTERFEAYRSGKL